MANTQMDHTTARQAWTLATSVHSHAGDAAEKNIHMILSTVACVSGMALKSQPVNTIAVCKYLLEYLCTSCRGLPAHPGSPGKCL